MFLICMLMPASISILIEKRIIKKELSNSDLILENTNEKAIVKKG